MGSCLGPHRMPPPNHQSKDQGHPGLPVPHSSQPTCHDIQTSYSTTYLHCPPTPLWLAHCLLPCELLQQPPHCPDLRAFAYTAPKS